MHKYTRLCKETERQTQKTITTTHSSGKTTRKTWPVHQSSPVPVSFTFCPSIPLEKQRIHRENPSSFSTKFSPRESNRPYRCRCFWHPPRCLHIGVDFDVNRMQKKMSEIFRENWPRWRDIHVRVWKCQSMLTFTDPLRHLDILKSPGSDFRCIGVCTILRWSVRRNWDDWPRAREPFSNRIRATSNDRFNSGFKHPPAMKCWRSIVTLLWEWSNRRPSWRWMSTMSTRIHWERRIKPSCYSSMDIRAHINRRGISSKNFNDATSVALRQICLVRGAQRWPSRRRLSFFSLKIVERPRWASSMEWSGVTLSICVQECLEN